MSSTRRKFERSAVHREFQDCSGQAGGAGRSLGERSSGTARHKHPRGFTKDCTAARLMRLVGASNAVRMGISVAGDCKSSQTILAAKSCKAACWDKPETCSRFRLSLRHMRVMFALFAAGHYYAVSAFGWVMQSGSSPKLNILRVIASDELLLGVASMVMLTSVMWA